MKKNKILIKLIIILLLIFILNKIIYGLSSFFSSNSTSYVENFELNVVDLEKFIKNINKTENLLGLIKVIGMVI